LEPLQDTFTVRTRDGREYAGLTLSSLRIAVSQKIFSPEDSARSDRMAGTWTPLARLLTIPDQAFNVTGQALPAVRPPEPAPVSTGIALDLDRHPAPPVQAPWVPASPAAPRPFVAQAAPETEEGPVRHRLRIAGVFLLLSGILGMVGYAYGQHSAAQSASMLVNTGLGIALLMNLQQVRKWAAGWVVAGWALLTFVAAVSGGCLGLILVGLFSGLVYGGPACLLWGEECPRARFWTGITLMGILALLVLLGLILVAVAGAALFRQMRF
jgi:hypothetical protein